MIQTYVVNFICQKKQHFQADSEYVPYVLYVKSAISLKWQVGFENDMKMTPIFTIIFISKMPTLDTSHNYNMLF